MSPLCFKTKTLPCQDNDRYGVIQRKIMSSPHNGFHYGMDNTICKGIKISGH